MHISFIFNVHTYKYKIGNGTSEMISKYTTSSSKLEWVLPSAKLWAEATIMKWKISLKNKLNKVWPTTDPCDTPDYFFESTFWYCLHWLTIFYFLVWIDVAYDVSAKAINS